MNDKGDPMTQAGYCECLAAFSNTADVTIVGQLKRFVPDAGDSQVRAWRDSIRVLKRAADQVMSKHPEVAETGLIILEYIIPLESRRIDALFLLNGVVVVLEFKGKLYPSQADLDQAAAYARDLRAYHRVCSDLTVKCLLVLSRGKGDFVCTEEVDIVGADGISAYCCNVMRHGEATPNAHEFLSLECYQPLPSLVRAARELFKSGTLTRIHRAAIATEPTLDTCSAIVHATAQKKRRALILICGVPGAGKTLVGLQLAHSKYLYDLSLARDGGKPTAPAVFLSGNGPLVEVLQYELRSAGGDGKAFVRAVHDYVKTFTRNAGLVPPQHVLIYDEAQRAFDAPQVQAKHPEMPAQFRNLSEPELFVKIAERIPEWCVVVGLIGSGQEIHIGEEAGLVQWKEAIAKAELSEEWDVYLPSNEDIRHSFQGLPRVDYQDSLELSVTIRFHLATRLYDFVQNLLEGEAEAAKAISVELERSGYNLRLTHNLEMAKDYLTNRYDRNSDARYGVVASSKDKELVKHGIPKGYKSPGEVCRGKYGSWYSDAVETKGSCTALEAVATEFGAQGLELDACLLAWGTDFIRENGVWSNRYASGYKEMSRIVDAKALRMNAYRVLLTRGRDGCVVFIPPIQDKMRETYKYLKACGFTELKAPPVECPLGVVSLSSQNCY